MLRRPSVVSQGGSLPGSQQVSGSSRRNSNLGRKGAVKICAVCEQAFKELIGPDGMLVAGCQACWKANNYEGPVPTEALSIEQITQSETNAKALMQKQQEEAERSQKLVEDRYQKLNQRLADLKSKDGLRQALHGLIKQIQARNMSEVELFNEIDQDGDGDLTRGELSAALRKMKIDLAPAELDGILRSIDLDGDGTIDFSEFYYLLKTEGDALMEAEGVLKEDDPRLLGFKLGQRVLIKVKLWTDEERAHRASFDYMPSEIDAGVVMGPGVRPGTLLVKYDRTGESFNMKPSQISKTSKLLDNHPLHCLCEKCNPIPPMPFDEDSDSISD